MWSIGHDLTPPEPVAIPHAQAALVEAMKVLVKELPPESYMAMTLRGTEEGDSILVTLRPGRLLTNRIVSIYGSPVKVFYADYQPPEAAPAQVAAVKPVRRGLSWFGKMFYHRRHEACYR